MKWNNVRLGSYCSKIGSGATPKGGSKVYKKNGTTLIRSQNIYNLTFSSDGLTHITDGAAQKLNNVSIEENDILLNITGDSVARTCVVPKEILPARVNQHVSIIRPVPEKLNYKYLNYFLASPFMQSYMLNLAVGKGASRNALTKSMIENFTVPLPPLIIQIKIANILSVYDDLIENNQKQIKLLEEAAMMLYKEWFVNLRFPGYETTKIVDGVPEGWKKGKTKDFISFNYGKALKAESRKGSRYPVYGSSGVIGYHGEYLVKGPVIIVGRKGNVGNTYISFENAYPIDTVYYINSKLNLYYTYFNLLLRSFVNNDSAVPGLNRNYAESTEMIAPSDLLMNMFNDKVLSIFGKQNILRSQINLLQQARDKLLPKLISGEIDIPEEYDA